MELSEQTFNHPNLIKEANHKKCHVGSRIYTESLIIPWQGEIQTFKAQSVTDLDEPLFNLICSKEPEVIVLATGAKIEYPDAQILAPLVNKQIGLEVMTNTAAARTVNVLMAENRRVVAVLII